MERTLIIIKPDARARALEDEILNIVSEGLRVVRTITIKMTKDQATRFYILHRDKEFFDGLRDYMTSGSSLIVVLEGENAVEIVRNRALNVIRPQYALSTTENSIHSSDSLLEAKREIEAIFGEGDIEQQDI